MVICTCTTQIKELCHALLITEHSIESAMKSSIFTEHAMLTRMGGAIAAIALIATIGMSISALVALSTKGNGEAINLAGSLRMQSWRMTSYYLALGRDETTEGEHWMKAATKQFEVTLNNPTLTKALSGNADSEVASSYARVYTHWQTVISPRLLALSRGATVLDDDAAARHILADINDFVAQIDYFVRQLANDTEAKIQVMSIMLGIALVVTVLIVLLTIFLIHTGMVTPLRALLNMTKMVAQGDLSVRTAHIGDDELGRLGQSFNGMAAELSKLYQNLEDRVAQKTAELTRSNQSLELLYHSIARLHGSAPTREIYQAVLQDIESVLGMGPGIVCLGARGGQTGRCLASSMQPGNTNPCDAGRCSWCLNTSTPRLSLDDDGRQLLTLPLSESGEQYGVMLIEVPAEHIPQAWQVQLLEALSRHIGVAIGADLRNEQTRKLALLEERAVIARELHDSLAQSLAYMKIQVSRLQSAISRPERSEQIPTMLAELRTGLSGAYLQLRELLTTFRLRMEGDDFTNSLQQTIAEFADRGQLIIALEHEIAQCRLSPNEEIHVLHIIREALANIINHAQASHAWIKLSCSPDGFIDVSIEDDGIGLIKKAETHHYGMVIMQERAKTLHGTFQHETRPGGGARVVLRFMPSNRKQAAGR